MRWLITLSLLLIFILSGCGEDTTVTKDNDFSPLTQIIVSSEYPFIADNTTSQFTAIGNYSDLYTRDITTDVIWLTADTSIATITSSGLVRAVSPGTALISATMDGIVGIFFLTVTDAQISRIDISPLTPTVSKGLTQKFDAIGTFNDASVQNLTNSVTWTSTNTNVAVIDQTGLAEGLDEGATNITAAFDGVTDTTQLSVTAASLVSIEITPSTAEVPQRVGVKFFANGLYSDNSLIDISDTVNWSSSNEAIAMIETIDKFGFATGSSAGTVTITATKDTQSDSATLTITDLILVQINISPVDPNVDIEIPEQMTATGVFDNNSAANITENVIWSTGDSTIATISNNIGNSGEVTGKSSGPTSVTAQSSSITDSTSLTIN